MSIYGNYFAQKNDSVALALENAPMCDYETFIESAIDANYFFESILDRAGVLSVVNEAEGNKKFDIKELIQTMIVKIKKMFEDFVGWVKKTIADFKDKMKRWCEEHSIQKGLLKVALHGFSYAEIAEAQNKLDNLEKYAESNGKEWADGLKNPEFPVYIDGQWTYIASHCHKHGIEILFEDEIRECEVRIRQLSLYNAGDAKDEYEKIKNNILELKKRITNLKGTDTEALGKDLEKAKDYTKSINDKFEKSFEAYYDGLQNLRKFGFGKGIERYIHTSNQVLSENQFNDLVKYVEETQKRINSIKSGVHYVNFAKLSIQRSNEQLETIRKQMNSKSKPSIDTSYNNNGDATAKFDDGYHSSDLYAAKLSVQMSTLKLQIATIGLGNAIKLEKNLSNLAFVLLVAYKVIARYINGGYLNPDELEKPSFKKKDREENLKKYGSSEN